MNASEYHKRQEGPATIFEVTPAPHKKFMFIVIMGGVLLLIALASFTSMPIFSLIMMGFAGWAIWFGWVRDLRPAAHRNRSTFKVTGETIESNGQSFRKDDIHRLIIKNGITNDVKGIPGVLIPVSASTAMGAAHRMQVALTANGLEVEAGGRGHVLAGGMDETTAFGLLSDVSRALGFRTTAT
jgi:hypothetical protein